MFKKAISITVITAITAFLPAFAEPEATTAPIYEGRILKSFDEKISFGDETKASASKAKSKLGDGVQVPVYNGKLMSIAAAKNFTAADMVASEATAGSSKSNSSAKQSGLATVKTYTGTVLSIAAAKNFTAQEESDAVAGKPKKLAAGTTLIDIYEGKVMSIAAAKNFSSADMEKVTASKSTKSAGGSSTESQVATVPVHKASISYGAISASDVSFTPASLADAYAMALPNAPKEQPEPNLDTIDSAENTLLANVEEQGEEIVDTLSNESADLVASAEEALAAVDTEIEASENQISTDSEVIAEEIDEAVTQEIEAASTDLEEQITEPVENLVGDVAEIETPEEAVIEEAVEVSAAVATDIETAQVEESTEQAETAEPEEATDQQIAAVTEPEESVENEDTVSAEAPETVTEEPQLAEATQAETAVAEEETTEVETTPEPVIKATNTIENLCAEVSKRLASVSQRTCNDIGLKASRTATTDGRAIAYRRYKSGKTGAPRVLVMGGLHGDEFSTVSLMFRWMEDNMPSKADTVDWYFLPSVNPDGLLYGKGKRTNGRGVDLNRNLPTTGWSRKAPRYWRWNGRDPRHYPGNAAASEKETASLVKAIDQYQPDIIVQLRAPDKQKDTEGHFIRAADMSKISKATTGSYPGSVVTYATEKNIRTLVVELQNISKLPTKKETNNLWQTIVDWAKK